MKNADLARNSFPLIPLIDERVKTLPKRYPRARKCRKIGLNSLSRTIYAR